MSGDAVIAVSSEARASLVALRQSEDEALSVEITGVDEGGYAYHLAFVPLDGAGPGDVVEHHGELAVLIPIDSVAPLRGASLEAVDGGIRVVNPNSPSPLAGDPAGPPPDLTGTPDERARRVVETQINPAVASHGGRVTFLGIEDGTAWVRLSGGCQGCTLAGVTLAEGIELLLKRAVPEITAVIDHTDHDAGTAPYFG